MRKEIKEDLYRYVGKESEKLFVQLRYFLFTPGFRYIYFLGKHLLLKINYQGCFIIGVCVVVC